MEGYVLIGISRIRGFGVFFFFFFSNASPHTRISVFAAWIDCTDLNSGASLSYHELKLPSSRGKASYVAGVISYLCSEIKKICIYK